MVKKTILKDPQVPAATITLKSEPGQKLSEEDQIEAIEVVLEMNGVHLEPYGEKFIRALPRKDARKEGIPLLRNYDDKLKERIHVVSMQIPFKNISTEEAQKVLEGFKSNSGILFVIERSNSILVTDTEQNVKRMVEIAKTIDVATPVLEDVFVRQIKNAAANDIKTALETIVQESQKELEKSGKAPAQNTAQPYRPWFNRPNGGPGSLLRRTPDANNQPAPAANNASVVMAVSDADRGMIRGKVLILADERSNKLIIITQKSNMDFFDKVIEQLDVETTPDTVVKVYRLKYADAEEVSDMINDLIGNAASSKDSNKNQNAAAKQGQSVNLSNNRTPVAKKPANQRTGEASAGELSKDNTTVLADKRINGLVVMTDKKLVSVLENIIESMDVKLSQVLIETCIIEVGLGNGLETGVDWVNNNWTKLGNNSKTATVIGGGGGGTSSGTLAALNGGTSDKTFSEWAQEAKSVLGNEKLSVEDVKKYIEAAKGYSIDTSVSPIGAGLNYFIKSDKLNLSAVLKAAKTDSRSKYIASPIIMTLDNKEATIDATEMRYLFKGYQYSGSTYNGSPVKDYEQKDLGIKIKVTPKINPNGAVLLEVEEEYSQEGAGQMVDDEIQATTITRKMAADALLEDGQTVIFGGLTQTVSTEKTGGIPLLKDIPWIGKWLFGYVSQAESRSELLVFMTPYVLDDAKSAQIEAARRKSVLSDPIPWDDHGWSASELADPVPQKEQLRRLKDEWKKQDEERKTRLAIEQEKINRANKLKELSKEEREVWLKMHKEELEKEEQEELEKKMLDKEGQEELKALVEKIKKDKLESAQKEIDKAEEMTRAENERAKLDAEKISK
jgi:type II secretion system protein D